MESDEVDLPDGYGVPVLFSDLQAVIGAPTDLCPRPLDPNTPFVLVVDPCQRYSADEIGQLLSRLATHPRATARPMPPLPWVHLTPSHDRSERTMKRWASSYARHLLAQQLTSPDPIWSAYVIFAFLHHVAYYFRFDIPFMFTVHRKAYELSQSGLGNVRLLLDSTRPVAMIEEVETPPSHPLYSRRPQKTKSTENNGCCRIL